MSKIYVCEAAGLGQTDNTDSVSILPAPSTIEYTVIVSAASSGAAQPIAASTKFVEISADTTCSVVIGPVGTTCALTNRRLQTNERIILRVPNVAPLRANLNQPAPPANFIFTTANV
jgi:hypothetical protein